MRQTPVRAVADALGVSYRQAQRMCVGYWPRDARAILRAWDVYKGRTSEQQSRWFLRRVQEDGVVLHAGRIWSAPALLAHAGQTVALARTGGDALLAQTLELSSQRFALQPLAAAARTVQ